MSDATTGFIDLYWIPLGAGAHVVRVSGKIFEALAAARHGRRPRALYHSALVVGVPEGRVVIEMTPIPAGRGAERGVVAEGPVGTRWVGRFRMFRYEIRRWLDGKIPDADQAIASPMRVADDLARARQLLDLLPSIPLPVWGRDELGAGEMWNSNSVVAWALACSGVDVTAIRPPSGGRAPGWNAGVVVAARAAPQSLRHEARIK